MFCKNSMRSLRSSLRSFRSSPNMITSFHFNQNVSSSNSLPVMTSASYSTKIEYINSPKAPKAVGPYSQAIKANGQIWVSGCLGLIPESGEFPSDDVVEQTRQALTNMVNVLEEANSTLERVVKTTVLLVDINDFKKVNEVYSEYFSSHKPARACFAVRDLPKGARVEIEAIALEE